MTTRDDIVRGIEAVDARVHGLTPRILTHSDAKLPEGNWHVREALCHVAARANSIPVALAAAARARSHPQGGPPAASSATEIDGVNQRQIDERQNRSLEDLLKEIHAGHRSAIMQVREFSEQELGERLLIRAAGGEMSFAELLLRAGPEHEKNHLNQVEKVLG